MIQLKPPCGPQREGIADLALEGANPESLSHGFLSLVLF